MRKYESLLADAYNEDIEVVELDLETDEVCGKCVGNSIFVNNRNTTFEKASVLSEELGHYYTTVGDITNQSELCNRKLELRARRFGYDKSIGLVGLVQAFENGCINRCETAEYLDVTVKYLDEAIDYYRDKYGIYYELDNYLIYFIPSLYIGKKFKY